MSSNWDNTLSQALSSGKRFICFDNVRGEINNQRLEMIITADHFGSRAAYEKARSYNRRDFHFFITGNEVKTTVDLINRVNPISIIKQLPNYEFQTFEEGDILCHIKANAMKYLSCIYAILNDWVKNGRTISPNFNGHTFRQWAEITDYIVQHYFDCVSITSGIDTMKKVIAANGDATLFQLCEDVAKAQLLNKELRSSNIAAIINGNRSFYTRDFGPDNGKSISPTTVGKKLTLLFNTQDIVQCGTHEITREKRDERDSTGSLKEVRYYTVRPLNSNA